MDLAGFPRFAGARPPGGDLTDIASRVAAQNAGRFGMYDDAALPEPRDMTIARMGPGLLSHAGGMAGTAPIGLPQMSGQPLASMVPSGPSYGTAVAGAGPAPGRGLAIWSDDDVPMSRRTLGGYQTAQAGGTGPFGLAPTPPARPAGLGGGDDAGAAPLTVPVRGGGGMESGPAASAAALPDPPAISPASSDAPSLPAIGGDDMGDGWGGPEVPTGFMPGEAKPDDGFDWKKTLQAIGDPAFAKSLGAITGGQGGGKGGGGQQMQGPPRQAAPFSLAQLASFLPNRRGLSSGGAAG